MSSSPPGGRRPGPALAALLLAACSAEGLTGEQLCVEAEITVANRIYACTADRDAANEGAEALADLGCRVEDLDEEESEPAIQAVESCLEALDAMDCEQTALGMESAENWLLVDRNCPTLYGPGEYPDPVEGAQP